MTNKKIRASVSLNLSVVRSTKAEALTALREAKDEALVLESEVSFVEGYNITEEELIEKYQISQSLAGEIVLRRDNISKYCICTLSSVEHFKSKQAMVRDLKSDLDYGLFSDYYAFICEGSNQTKELVAQIVKEVADCFHISTAVAESLIDCGYGNTKPTKNCIISIDGEVSVYRSESQIDAYFKKYTPDGVETVFKKGIPYSVKSEPTFIPK